MSATRSAARPPDLERTFTLHLVPPVVAVNLGDVRSPAEVDPLKDLPTLPVWDASVLRMVPANCRVFLSREVL